MNELKSLAFILALQSCADTGTLAEQDFPPTDSAKEAVPAADGLPAMLYTNSPGPSASLPPVREAVRPVTPVD
jgi:hypothetical protein